VTAAQPAFLILNMRDYPAWHVFLNGHLDPDRGQRDDGLIALAVPAGTSTIDIRYGRTADQTLGDGVTFFGLLNLLAMLIASRKRAPLRQRG
jgi:hypothetical protein